MFDNQHYENLKSALEVRAALQQVNERVLNETADAVSQHEFSYTVKTFDALGNQYLPTDGPTKITLSAPPQENTLVKVSDAEGKLFYGIVKRSPVHGQELHIEPVDVNNFHQLLRLQPVMAAKRSYSSTLEAKHHLPVFFEPAERLIYKLFNVFFHRFYKEYTIEVYIVELVLIILLAVIGMVAIWTLAVLLI